MTVLLQPCLRASLIAGSIKRITSTTLLRHGSQSVRTSPQLVVLHCLPPMLQLLWISALSRLIRTMLTSSTPEPERQTIHLIQGTVPAFSSPLTEERPGS